MKKWVAALAAVAGIAVVGAIVHQVVSDLSSNAKLWTAVTDDPWASDQN